MTPSVTTPTITAPVPTQQFPRPKYLVYDRQDRRWWRPLHEAWRGRLEDLSLSPSGELLLRTLARPSVHESLFKDRYIVVPHLDNFTPSLN